MVHHTLDFGVGHEHLIRLSVQGVSMFCISMRPRPDWYLQRQISRGSAGWDLTHGSPYTPPAMIERGSECQFVFIPEY